MQVERQYVSVDFAASRPANKHVVGLCLLHIQIIHVRGTESRERRV